MNLAEKIMSSARRVLNACDDELDEPMPDSEAASGLDGSGDHNAQSGSPFRGSLHQDRDNEIIISLG